MDDTLQKSFRRHAVIGARPYCSPEYSPDFYKLRSVAPHDTFRTMLNVKRNTQIPLRASARTSESLSDKQEEIEEVKKLEEWRPAEDVFTAVLAELDAKRVLQVMGAMRK